MLYISLGDMKGADGASLRYEANREAGDYARRMADLVKRSEAYGRLEKKVPSERLLLYFQFTIKNEIYPYIVRACAIRWHRRNGKEISRKDSTLTLPETPIFRILAEEWRFDDVSIAFAHPVIFTMRDIKMLRQALRSYAKRLATEVAGAVERLRERKVCAKESMVACHYSEGLDLTKRNDINWYSGSGIPPGKILLYFDTFSLNTSRKITDEIIGAIEDKGFRWVSLRRGIVERGDRFYWTSRNNTPRGDRIRAPRGSGAIELLTAGIANALLEEVHYWGAFHRDFNVKIHYIPDNVFSQNIAQAIAFDIDKKEPGILVGKQRSEIFIENKYNLGFEPKHLYFIWSGRVAPYFDPNLDRVEAFIVNGYPNNIFQSYPDRSGELRSKGAAFIIAFYDNTFGEFSHISPGKMEAYYLSFLRWVIEDRDVGIIIKSKRREVLERLPAVREIFRKALETGRCSVIDELGRLPVEAAFGCDMLVGCGGVATAITESAITGCRGIHYDMSSLKSHEFYRWGHNELIFDDLDRMMKTLKEYKMDPARHPKLGDWSSHLNELDPYHDGKGGERMGEYMGHLFASIDVGMDRAEAIARANRAFSQKWGSDKVITINRYE